MNDSRNFGTMHCTCGEYMPANDLFRLGFLTDTCPRFSVKVLYMPMGTIIVPDNNIYMHIYNVGHVLCSYYVIDVDVKSIRSQSDIQQRLLPARLLLSTLVQILIFRKS
jgi:hypothetical protein